MNKRGSMALAAIAIILALIVLGVFLVNVSLRQCNSNRDCPDNAYCGADHECHQYPEKIVISQNNFMPAAIIFGVFLVVAAIIFRGGKLPWKKDIPEE